MKHLTDDQLGAYMDGVLKGRDAEAAGRHIAACQPCREALAELATQDESLKSVLTHDPGEAYFESFASRVEERIAEAAASRARPRGAFDLGRLFRSPRALAWAGGVAVVVVGGGLALMTSRDVLPPALRDKDLAARLERTAPGEVQRAPTRETGQSSSPVPSPSADEAGPAAPSADAGASARDAAGVEASVPERGSGLDARGQRRAPATSMAKERGTPDIEVDGSPARPAVDAKARADAFAPPPPSQPSATPAPAGARPASPSRAREVRRNEGGEELSTRRPEEGRGAPPPSPTAASGADRPAQVRKKLFAEPLGAVKTEDESRLCGEVRDAAGRSIVGAQVVVTDLGRTTTTDATGRFCMSVPKGEHPLSVMAVGYVESRMPVRAGGAEAAVRVTLAAVSALDGNGVLRTGRAAPRAPVATPSQPRSETQDEPRDSYSALSDTVRRVVREAQRLSADAARRRSAAHYDFAARAWERALRRLAEGPLEIETRRHLAEARYRAWENGPNARRAQAALEALTAYASRAPAGPERDEAARWLDRVKP